MLFLKLKLKQSDGFVWSSAGGCAQSQSDWWDQNTDLVETVTVEMEGGPVYHTSFTVVCQINMYVHWGVMFNTMPVLLKSAKIISDLNKWVTQTSFYAV